MNTPPHPFILAGLTIDPPVFLAPMAGITHVAFRQLVASFGGCGLYFSEMLSARRLSGERVEQNTMLRRFSNETPFFYQLMGSDPEEMALAVTHIEQLSDERGNRPDGIDINMGCSAPEIRKGGAGSGLMNDRETARRILERCRNRTDLPLTVKMRIGNEEDLEEMLSFASVLQDAGADAITLHPRLIKEKFKRSARWKYVQALKQHLTIPVIGNGDIECLEDIERRREETGCDGIMIGRLAVMKPWIFRAYVQGREPEVDKRDVYMRFVELLGKYIDPRERQVKLMLFTRYYAGNFAFGHQLEKRVRNAPGFDAAVSEAERFLDNPLNVAG